jgi:ketosteroid isomerase-like protein
MATANAQLLQGTYEAFGRGEIEAVLGAFDEDIAWHVPEVIPHGVTATGREEVGQFFQRLAATWEDFGLELDDISADGDRGYATGTASGTLDGRRTSYGFVHAWTFRDGALVRFDEYVDPPPELVAAGAGAATAQ